jgi:hypothetical protein
MATNVVATEWRGRSRPVEVDVTTQLPVDRTVCPACLSQPEIVNCPVCNGEPVCPTCRGARQLSTTGARVGYKSCWGCSYENGDFDQKKQWEGSSLSHSKRAATINAYRSAHTFTPAPPAIDPWTNYEPKEPTT